MARAIGANGRTQVSQQEQEQGPAFNMARPTSIGGDSRIARLSLSRQALLQSQIQGRDIDERRNTLLETIPEYLIEDETQVEGDGILKRDAAVPTVINIGDYLYPDEISEDGTTVIVNYHNDNATEHEDGREETSTFRIELSKLMGLNAERFVRLARQHPEQIHFMLCRAEQDHRDTAKIALALQGTIELNEEETGKVIGDLKAELESAKDKMRKQADRASAYLANLRTAKQELAAASDNRYKQAAEDLRDWLKTAEAKNADILKELEGFKTAEQDHEKDVQDIKDSYEKDIQELKNQLEEAQRGRTRQLQPPRRSSFSASVSRRRHGRERSQQPQPPRHPSPAPSKADSLPTAKNLSNSHNGSSSDDSSNSDSDLGNYAAHRKYNREKKDKDTEAVKNDFKSLTTFDDTLTTLYKTDKSVPLPEAFKGEVDENGKTVGPELEKWLRRLETKLGCTTFKNAYASLKFVHDLTDGEAFELLDGRVPSQSGYCIERPYKDINKMIKDLQGRYGERDPVGKAHDEMSKLIQGSDESFSKFYVKWRKNANRMRLKDPEATLNLTRKLNKRYGSKVADGTLYRNVSALVTRLYVIENQFSTLDAIHGKPGSSGKKSSISSSSNSNTRTGSSNSTTSNRSAVSRKPWAERPSQYQSLGPLDKAENGRCMKESLCKKCRQPGHTLTNKACPLYDFAMPPRPNASGTNASVQEEQGNGESTA